MNKAFVYIFIFISTIGISQPNPHAIDKYSFIHYSKNILNLYGSESEFEKVFLVLDSLQTEGKGNLNVLHFGDSHIQADYFSGKMRRNFYEYFFGADGSRGYVFPYDVAGTNNPSNYYTNKTGSWSACKNISKTHVCDLGVSGMSLITYSPYASLEFFQRSWDNYPIYKFDVIKVFHKFGENSFAIVPETDAKIIDTIFDEEHGYTQFVFDSAVTAIKLRFQKQDSLQTNFEYYGISLESSWPGITYSALGVNGADTDDWLRCDLFNQHLQGISPNLVIISLGTNDGYVKYFSEALFTEQYDSLVRKVKRILPDAAIILTTPGDNYRYKRYLNKNTEKTQRIIHQIAQKNKCAVWDFYTIMGGQNSIVLWNNKGLTAKDRLHYSRKGYELQGDILFSAFMKAYDIHLESQKKNYPQSVIPIPLQNPQDIRP